MLTTDVALTAIDLDVLMKAMRVWRVKLAEMPVEPTTGAPGVFYNVVLNHAFDLEERLADALEAYRLMNRREQVEDRYELPF